MLLLLPPPLCRLLLAAFPSFCFSLLAPYWGRGNILIHGSVYGVPGDVPKIFDDYLPQLDYRVDWFVDSECLTPIRLLMLSPTQAR